MTTQTIIEPNIRSQIGFFKTLVVMSRNIKDSLPLIKVLFLRDFLSSYKKSFLGIAWLVVTPLLGVAQWILMNSSGILQPGDVGIPYPAYVLISMSFWGLFIGFYQSAVSTLDAGNGFILQVKYSHESLLIKQVAQHLANFFISFFINLIVLLFFKVVPSWQIIFFPFMMLPLLFFGSGFGLLVSVFGVVVPEVRRLTDIFLGLLVWVTPIIYSKRIDNPILQKVIRWNPLTYLIGGLRDTMLFGRLDSPKAYIIAALASVVIFFLSLRIFYISEEKVLEKML